MKTIQTIAIHEIKVMFRRKMFRIMTVGLPAIALVALLVIAFIQSQEDDPKEVQAGYVDATGLFVEFRTQGNVEFVPYKTPEIGMGALLAEDIKRLYVIPPDYLTSGVVQRFTISAGIDLDDGGDAVLRSFLFDNLVGTDLPPEVVQRLRNPLNLSNVQLDSEGAPRDIDAGRVVFFLGMGMLLCTSLLMTGGFLLQGLGEEKESRIMEVLLSSVTPAQLMVGKILGLGAAGLAQMLIWVVSGLILLNVTAAVGDFSIQVPGPGSALLGVVFFVLGYLFFATLMAGLGAVTPTAREGEQLSFMFVMPIVISLSLWFYIVANPTVGIVRFLTLFPFTSPIVVMERLAVGVIEPLEIAASLGVLVLSVAGAMYLMARVFRAYLLMYGKRPGLREVARTLARAKV